MAKIEINEDGRLDVVLAKILNISRSKVASYLENPLCTLNDKPILKNGTKVKKGDIVNLELEEKVKEFKTLDLKLDIVYEDDYLLVINKPRNLVVHPAVGHENDTLVNALAKYFNKKEEDFTSDFRMGIVHRIDKDTSGLLVVAKTMEVKTALSQMVEKHLVEREYLALASGFFKSKNFKIDAPIARNKYNRQQMCVSEEGKNAITHFKLIHQFNDCGLLSCKLETGRTHQIRVHLAFIKHPIVGDEIYNPKKVIFANNGQLLHAFKLSFIHPVLNKKMSFYAEPDKYFISCLVKFGKGEN